VAYDEALADRVREVVASLTHGEFSEKKMFGGLAFLTDGHMGVAVSREGGLMLRVDPAQTDTMLAKSHAGPFHMRGRPIDGWVRVEVEGLRTRAQLERWVRRGVQYVRGLPPA
jgi:TfoX/Sxy family transcriptional regulator of competence genes